MSRPALCGGQQLHVKANELHLKKKTTILQYTMHKISEVHEHSKIKQNYNYLNAH